MNSMGGHSGGGLDQTEIRFLVERNADGILVVDEDGIVLFANPAAEQIFGRPHRALIGTPIGVPVTAGETAQIAVRKPDGSQLEAEVRVVETVWAHRPARLASLRDISGRKAIEERLSHAVRMEAVGRLTGRHCARLQQSADRRAGQSRERPAQAGKRRSCRPERTLDNAQRGARRAAGLTQRLLAFARRKPLEPKVIDVNGLVSGMTDLLQRTLGEAIRVRTAPSPDLWLVDVDPTELEAAILNLAVNARDAMPSGGELRVETRNVELDFSDAAAVDAQPGPYVAIAVTDTGVGMTPDVLRHVFEPFFTTKGGQGTGSGPEPSLRLRDPERRRRGPAQRSGQRHDGDDLSCPGPTAQRPPRADGLAPAVQTPRGKQGESILVVEDDDDVRAFTVGSLRDLGYAVFEAADAASALAILAREPTIDLLFTDLGLPDGVYGKALSERARALRPSLGVLITTAYAAAALIHDGRLDQGIDVLVKPFTVEALAARIREMMDQPRGQPDEIRILVVEDEMLVRLYLVQTLHELGCQVEEAANAGEALSTFAARGDRFTMAMVDLGLPDRPGDEVVKEMRRARPDLPVVLATGHADATVRQRLAGLPALQVLQKPFHRADIEAVFSRLGIDLPVPRVSC